MKFLFIIHIQAVRTYGHEIQVTELLDKLDFYVLPVLNIDGYIYTWTKVYAPILREADETKTNPSLLYLS